jgi:hypothetical protein
MDASKRVDYVKIHLKTKQEIEKKSEYYAAKANKNGKQVIFQPEDLVWVHLRKDRFPEKQKSKLQPQGDEPFKVLTRINDNAYKLELPGDDYVVSNMFNVADLSPFFGLEGPESRSTPFQEGRMMRTSTMMLSRHPLPEIMTLVIVNKKAMSTRDQRFEQECDTCNMR